MQAESVEAMKSLDECLAQVAVSMISLILFSFICLENIEVTQI